MLSFFLARVITGFGDVIIILICLQAIMSWFARAFSGGLMKFYDLLCTIVDPFIRPFRKLTMRFAYSFGIDFSPLIAIIVIQLVCRLAAVLILSL